MSLSGQYLEELSKRYKKQVEEMQRSLERAIILMGEESRRGEEREARRLEEIIDLREQVSTLSRSLGSLISEKESWRSKFSLIGKKIKKQKFVFLFNFFFNFFVLYRFRSTRCSSLR